MITAFNSEAPSGTSDEYDVIVVGAGHAGCEAAAASARCGARTLLLTIDLDRVAHLSCNPSIGGPAKGHIVREIDALGGLMARVIDRCFIQIRELNESKGPAVRALRAQADKRMYARVMKETLETIPGLDLKQAMVERILPPPPHVAPQLARFTVVSQTGRAYRARAVVLTTGTFLRGRAVTGSAIWGAGRAGEAPAVALSEDLASLGFPLVRLKTGTPPRIDARTVQFALTELQEGSESARFFGHYDASAAMAPPAFPFAEPPASCYPIPRMPQWRAQLPCYLVHTTAAFHQIVQNNLDRAPLFSGVIEGTGPRYCPSIEDKIVRFAEKERHGMFLEPEGWTTGEMYVQGCNTSLPEDVQWEMLRTIPALRHVELTRIGYAIEYDAVATGEISATLEARRLRGLFLAGQINGTTGYEEAAAQGIVAGVNAAQRVLQRLPLVLRRDESYIGVLIDDLVTKEIREPYRMFTSRSEHRLLLRTDNADLRLSAIGAELGLLDSARIAAVERKRAQIEQLSGLLQNRRVFPSRTVNEALQRAGLAPITVEMTAEELLRRPDTTYDTVRSACGLPDAPADVIEQVEIAARYSGYIAKQQREVDRLKRMESRQIPDGFDFASITNIREEARQTLIRFQPTTIGQAARLAGINPADVAVLLVAIDRRNVMNVRQVRAAESTYMDDSVEPSPCD